VVVGVAGAQLALAGAIPLVIALAALALIAVPNQRRTAYARS